MHVTSIEECPVNHRGGQVSYLLMEEGSLGARNLLITWVEGDPGSEQPLHSHITEQVYVITEGNGLMTVAEEQREVGPGMLVFIPPGARHSIRNIGEDVLRFISAASPPIALPAEPSEFAYKERRQR